MLKTHNPMVTAETLPGANCNRNLKGVAKFALSRSARRKLNGTKTAHPKAAMLPLIPIYRSTPANPACVQ
jgi:hypothetical protein